MSNIKEIRFRIGQQDKTIWWDKRTNKVYNKSHGVLSNNFATIMDRTADHSTDPNDQANRDYPEMDLRALDLFISLLLTPKGCKVSNPYSLDVSDLELVFLVFADKQGDESIRNELIRRLQCK